MESFKSKNDVESEAVNKIAGILNRVIESGNLTMEMLNDENFAEDIVKIYIELESKDEKVGVKYVS